MSGTVACTAMVFILSASWRPLKMSEALQIVLWTNNGDVPPSFIQIMFT